MGNLRFRGFLKIFREPALLEIPIDFFGSLLPHPDGFDNGHFVNGDRISCGKHTGARGHETAAVQLDTTPAGQCNFFCFMNVRHLADGQNHKIGILAELAALNRNRPAATGLIRFGEFHPDADEALDTEFFIAVNPDRRCQIFDGYPFGFRFFNFFRQRRHLRAASSVKNADIL